MLKLIPPSDIPEMWPQIAEWVKSVADSTNGRAQPVDFAEDMIADKMALWVKDPEDPKGIVLTRFDKYPRALVCHVAAVVGEDAIEWIHEADETIGAWARDAGCTIFESLTRPGWERVMKKDWTKSHVLLERVLNG